MHIKNSTEVIFQIIKKLGPLYNNEISEYAGVVKSTVTTAVKELIRIGVVEEEPSINKRKRLRLAEDLGMVFGIYMGLTSLHIALCDFKATILDSVEFEIDFNTQTPDEITRILINTMNNFNFSNLLGIGIGVPGPVNFEKKVCVQPPEMFGWDGYPICSILQEYYNCEVILDNDVNVLALGEKAYGEAMGISNFIYVKVGTGIGAGLMIDDNIYRGTTGAAGDIGHISIDNSEIVCICGNKGCLESVAASRGIVGEALSNMSNSPFLSSFKKEDITAMVVGEGMVKGDNICTQIIINSGHNIGVVLSKIVNFFNPSLIVIGGGISKSGPKFIASIQEVLYRRSTALATSNLIVRKSSMLDAGGMIGAAILVIDQILDDIMKKSFQQNSKQQNNINI